MSVLPWCNDGHFCYKESVSIWTQSGPVIFGHSWSHTLPNGLNAFFFFRGVVPIEAKGAIYIGWNKMKVIIGKVINCLKCPVCAATQHFTFNTILSKSNVINYFCGLHVLCVGVWGCGDGEGSVK